MGDDGNRQVALTLDRVDLALGLNPEQFAALEAQLGGINGAVNKLAENVAEPDTSVAAEVVSLKQEIAVGFAGVNQSIANLNNTIHDRAVDLAKWLAAIALAASTPEDNSAEVQRRIDQLTASLKPEADAFESAVKSEGE